ncbi:MAG TPA: prepilin-type N-terminal cleavage/methylation domain-containing protein [Chthoniobacteraceae bacterium]|nr:prepilin-type N-terminal cleavage/methylation domain-containing protein [Chthoniobacteraceae bacterium]
MKTSHKSDAFTLIELLVVISIIAILASIAIPVFGSAQEKAQMNKGLQQAKGIFYGLKMFAGDHNGAFPAKKDEDEGNASSGQLNDANEAYANLVPAYVQGETPFGIPSSRYCKDATGAYKGPDNDISTRQKVLERGENTFAYVSGLSDTSNASWPILADGFAKGSEQNPVYSKKEGDYGAVWKGRRAIIVRCDGSATIENVNQNNLTVVRKGGSGNRNLFKEDSSDTDPWLVGAKVLNPRS